MDIPLGLTLEKVEELYILATLKKHNQNRTHAAIALDISLRGLRIKLSQYRLEGALVE